jgi:hypothetical protein
MSGSVGRIFADRFCAGNWPVRASGTGGLLPEKANSAYGCARSCGPQVTLRKKADINLHKMPGNNDLCRDVQVVFC